MCAERKNISRKAMNQILQSPVELFCVARSWPCQYLINFIYNILSYNSGHLSGSGKQTNGNLLLPLNDYLEHAL